MLAELAAMGFSAVELGHGIRQSLVEGVLKYLERGTLRVTSTHNFCPLPVEVWYADPDCLEFTAAGAAVRRRAVRLTKETVDFAVKVGAGRVVLHLGSVSRGKQEAQLARCVGERGAYGRRSVELKLAALRRRDREAGVAWERVHECLGEIIPYARGRGVRLAAECRSSVFELPLETEWRALWEKYGVEDLGYWHDFGHMQRKENLTFGDHWEALTAQRGRILGAHVHDTVPPVKDHRPMGLGNVAWERLLGVLPMDIPLVLEMSPAVKPEGVLASRERLDAVLAGNPKSESPVNR